MAAGSGGEPLLKHLAALAQRYGLNVWQWLPGYVGTHASGSYHYQHFADGVGMAFDARGPRLLMRAYAFHLRKFYKDRLTEGIHNAGVIGVNLSVKHGQNVPAAYWGDVWAPHRDHVHVAVRQGAP